MSPSFVLDSLFPPTCVLCGASAAAGLDLCAGCEASFEASNEPVLAGPMLVVAAVGLAVNLLVAFVLRRHDHDDINTRAAFLHVLDDALSSVGVIAAAMRGVTAGADVHDLHVWTVGPGYPVLSAHVVLSDQALSGNSPYFRIWQYRK